MPWTHNTIPTQHHSDTASLRPVSVHVGMVVTGKPYHAGHQPGSQGIFPPTPPHIFLMDWATIPG